MTEAPEEGRNTRITGSRPVARLYSRVTWSLNGSSAQAASSVIVEAVPDSRLP
jgi:hypothetical protein